jgi:ABC-type lipoprotein release transport system permease subunit
MRAAGAGSGVCEALDLSRILEKEQLLFGVGANVLGFVTLVASFVPALRAATLDPMRALRME